MRKETRSVDLAIQRILLTLRRATAWRVSHPRSEGELETELLVLFQSSVPQDSKELGAGSGQTEKELRHGNVGNVSGASAGYLRSIDGSVGMFTCRRRTASREI